MMLVIGLTDKRNAAENNQTKWTLDAVMIGWCVVLWLDGVLAHLLH